MGPRPLKRDGEAESHEAEQGELLLHCSTVGASPRPSCARCVEAAPSARDVACAALFTISGGRPCSHVAVDRKQGLTQVRTSVTIQSQWKKKRLHVLGPRMCELESGLTCKTRDVITLNPVRQARTRAIVFELGSWTWCWDSAGTQVSMLHWTLRRRRRADGLPPKKRRRGGDSSFAKLQQLYIFTGVRFSSNLEDLWHSNGDPPPVR